MADSDDDDSIEAIVKKDQDIWRKKAKEAKFTGKTKAALYKEARIIDREYQKAKLNHNWASAYYFLHLYVTICLDNGLHKGDKTTKIVSVVLENLNKIEGRLEIARKGMVFQYQHARDVEAKELAEKQRIAQAAAAALAMPKSQQAIVVAPPNVSDLTLEQMNAAVDALRMPGQSSSFSTIPSAVIAVSAVPVVGKVVNEEHPLGIPPPAYNGKTDQSYFAGGMTPKCVISDDQVTTLTLKQVIGDGSCAFRSIAQGRKNGKLSPEQEKKDSDQLRQIAVNLLRKRGKEEMVGSGMTIEQVVLMKDSYVSYEKYCEAMSRSEYAGETEFWLLSEELQMRISIFIKSDEEEGGLEHMITYGTAPVQPVCLLWQRGASEAGNHYDCLLLDA